LLISLIVGYVTYMNFKRFYFLNFLAFYFIFYKAKKRQSTGVWRCVGSQKNLESL
jgi:hypothetical protein